MQGNGYDQPSSWNIPSGEIRFVRPSPVVRKIWLWTRFEPVLVWEVPCAEAAVQSKGKPDPSGWSRVGWRVAEVSKQLIEKDGVK